MDSSSFSPNVVDYQVRKQTPQSLHRFKQKRWYFVRQKDSGETFYRKRHTGLWQSLHSKTVYFRDNSSEPLRLIQYRGAGACDDTETLMLENECNCKVALKRNLHGSYVYSSICLCPILN
ncbi:unnamed protein product [Peronospora belbahrii]|uniref:Uncharacterized protein n=1 Tax=Peronospora belbahrii TaxID=622444 RepID=A0ABN8CYA1_9STRA|nr:unnamed protein product [Peronospora belbahrii]